MSVMSSVTIYKQDAGAQCRFEHEMHLPEAGSSGEKITGIKTIMAERPFYMPTNDSDKCSELDFLPPQNCRQGLYGQTWCP